MLAIALFWAAIPAMACLVGKHSPAQHACCAEMNQHCSQAGKDASAPCCELHGHDGAIATGLIPVQERHNWLAVVPGWSGLQLSALSETGAAVAFEAPLPRTSSSGSSILRI
jgi:hypothetical protein